MSEKPPIIGIDLGTTNSLVSVLSQGESIVIPNSIGELLTPSAVSVLPNGHFVVGAAAKARAVTHPETTAVAFKRDMGTTKTISLGGVTFTPQQLSALVLGSLKHDAESYLGCTIEEAVITVPAYFGDLQRQATRDAGVIAGLKVERIINEPTAAALAYGLHQARRDVRAVVLDLGGGTFDITVLEIIEGVVEVQSSAGDARLGGDDFDTLLAGAIAERVAGVTVQALREHAASWARILEAAEQVKRRLSQADTATVALLDLPILESPSRAVELTLARSDVEALWAPLIERMRAPIVRALSDARITPDVIAEVLLVGGSTRMPCVARLAAQMFGRMPLRTLPPDEAVALGAAVQAGLKQGDAAVEDMVVTDVAPFTLGISTVAELGSHLVPGLYTPIIDRGTVIPTSRVKQFATVRDRQTMIKVEVFQGEHSLCRDNQPLGDLLVENLAAKPAGEEAIDVRFTYDLNGILEVEVTVLGTGRKESVVLERTPGRLTKAQVNEARQQMQRLKMHPREALPNTVALSRADALFTQLTGRDRDVLGAAIAQFRIALESQEEKDIVEARDYLNVVVQAVRRST